VKVNGSCYCGKIVFEAEVDPAKTSICYCTDCQRLSGTAYRVSANAAGNRFKITSGSPKEFIKVAASGSRRIQAFCQDCGTALYATAVEGDRSYNIRVGTLDQRAALAPVKQIWCDSALPWLSRMEIESWGRQG
jgi:hypothetical protein